MEIEKEIEGRREGKTLLFYVQSTRERERAAHVHTHTHTCACVHTHIHAYTHAKSLFERTVTVTTSYFINKGVKYYYVKGEEEKQGQHQ